METGEATHLENGGDIPEVLRVSGGGLQKPPANGNLSLFHTESRIEEKKWNEGGLSTERAVHE